MPLQLTNAITTGTESSILLSQGINDDESVYLDMVVIAVDEQMNVAQFDRTARLKRKAGQPTDMFATPKNNKATSGSTIGWDCEIYATADGYQIVVTGAAGRTIKWAAEVQEIKKSFPEYF